MAPRRDWICMAVVAGNRGLSCGRLEEAADDLHGRRFAGAIGAQEPHNLAALDRKGDVVDRGQAAEPLDQVPCFDERHRFRSRNFVTGATTSGSQSAITVRSDARSGATPAARWNERP